MSSESALRLSIAAVMAAMIAIASVHRWRAHRAGGHVPRREEGLLLMVALRLCALGSYGAIITWLVHPGALDWSRIEVPEPLRWLGAGLALAGLPLFWWVFHTLGLNVTDTVAVRAANSLVTHGPYRWVRHPLYSTAFVTLTAFALVTASWFVALMGVGALALLVRRAPLEEAKLIERHGDAYHEYMRRTPAYLPRLGGRA